MNIQIYIKNLVLIFICSTPFVCFSQCAITAPKNNTVCLGSPGNFSISTPPGTTFLSADWQFGDGYTGIGQKPGHLYYKAGTFTVRCLVRVSGGGTCEDSVVIRVLNLPQSKVLLTQTDTCFGKNKICLEDQSQTAKPSQSIIKRLIVWDDGSYDLIDSFQIKCHTYKQKAQFRITLEATDNEGCKNINHVMINIVPGMEPKFKETVDAKCGLTDICFMNTTDTTPGNKNVFTWQFDSGARITSSYNAKPCFTFKTYKDLSAKLIVSNIYGCHDSFSYVFPVDVDTLPDFKFVLSDTSVCYNTVKPLSVHISPQGSFTYQWSFNGVIKGENGYKGDIFPKRDSLYPGPYMLSCTMQKGACKQVIDTHFTVRGPVAKIEIFNKIQCDASKRVYFVDRTLIGNYQRSSRFWTLEDKFGDSCICKRESDINKYKNCNFSNDWYHKHDYKESRRINLVYFEVYDSMTGCGDKVKDTVNTNACGFNKKDTICEGGVYLLDIGGILRPTSFSLDSGITWLSFPSGLGKSYKGHYSVLLRYTENKKLKAEDFGDDSIKLSKDSIRYYYRYLKDQLLINDVPNASFKFTMTGNCSYKDVVLKLDAPALLAGEVVIFYWGDGQSDTLKVTVNMVFDSIRHHYNLRSMDSRISVSKITSKGCWNAADVPINFGFEVYLEVTGYPCLRNDICFEVYVYDKGFSRYWDNTNKLGSVKVYSGESKTFSNEYNRCFRYDSIGKKRITLIARSDEGCEDTLSKVMFQSDLRAGVTRDSKTFGCGEIKRLYDSSLMISPDYNDQITGYLWDFGTNTFSTTEKDPYHSFSKFGNYQVTHVVKTLNGCTDTVKYLVNVSGPQPYFDILTDTIGCEPLTVRLRNRSVTCTQYNWRLGDPQQTSIFTDSISDIVFTYSTPGKYYIKLTGIDSFYSSTTNSIYYCQNSFPDDTAKRSVTVLPFLKAGFNGDSNICVGQTLNLANLSDTRYNTLKWDFGDGTKRTVPFEYNTFYTYSKAGRYQIVQYPDYPGSPGVPKCLDTASQMITVKGILADFRHERICESPLIKFTNASVPENNNTRYYWDFGQPSAPENHSTLKDPSHDYGTENGIFSACLRLNDEFGCADSMCVNIWNDYKIRFIIPNVFTPGNKDDKNDEYDIDIVGEEKYELTIFNRWGQIVYQSKKDGERGDGSNWNGQSNNTGPACPEGTYFYLFNYKNCYGDPESKRVTGSITLIR